MERFYRELPWLDMEQALDYLKRITKPQLQLSEQGLLQLGRAKRIAVFVEIDPRGITGKIAGTKESVTLTGMQQVLNPDDALGVNEEQTCAVLKHGAAYWVGLLPSWSQKTLFRPEDIRSFAEKMNDGAESAQIENVNAAISSDVALAAAIRQQQQELGRRPREVNEARKLNYQIWRDTAEDIKRGRSRPISNRELAALIRKQLSLNDSIETIRKHL